MFKANIKRAEKKSGLLCEGGVGEMNSLFGDTFLEKEGLAAGTIGVKLGLAEVSSRHLWVQTSATKSRINCQHIC